MTEPTVYPAGALLRATQICRDPKTGRQGLLPINRSTWYAWVKEKRVPPGRRIGGKTVVWPIEVVLALDKRPSEQTPT